MRVFQAPSSAGLVLNVTSTLRLSRWFSSCPVLVAGFDRLAVDREQVVADRDLDPVLVGGTVLVDVRHLVSSGRRVGFELDAEMACRNAAAAADRRGGGAAPVCEAFNSPIISLMMLSSSCRSPTYSTSGSILRPHRVPVVAVHLRIVEAILHRPPGVVEHLLPLCGSRSIRTRGVKLTRRRAVSRPPDPAPRRPPLRHLRCPPPLRDRRRVNAAALAEVERAAVARDSSDPRSRRRRDRHRLARRRHRRRPLHRRQATRVRRRPSSWIV